VVNSSSSSALSSTGTNAVIFRNKVNSDLLVAIAGVNEGAELVARAQTYSEPEGDGGSERDSREEVGGKLVVAGRDAAEVFEPAEGVLDQVSRSVALSIVADRAFSARATRDDRDFAVAPERPAKGVRIVALVGDHIARLAGAGEDVSISA